MYQLPCPNCHATIPVSPSKAGDEFACPSCHQLVLIPKLGELRQLSPQPTEPRSESARSLPQDAAFGSRILMALLGLIATASLMIAGYCGVRWSLVEVAATTDSHLAEIEQQYPTLRAAEVLREYEQVQKMGIDLPNPYQYKVQQNTKRQWGMNAASAAGLGVAALLGSIFFAASSRKKLPQS